jgi:hypothetical protein
MAEWDKFESDYLSQKPTEYGRKRQLKVYGTRRKGHREHWTVKGKGRYYWVRRDSKGRILGSGKWSPKEPLSKTVFTETEPLIIGYTRGKEAYAKVTEVASEWEWIKFEAES